MLTGSPTEMDGQENKGVINLPKKLLFLSFCSLFFFIPVATTPAVIFGLVSLGIWLLSGEFIKARRHLLSHIWIKPVVLFMLLPWIGLLWTEDPAGGVEFATKSYYWLYAFAIASLHLPNRHIIILLSVFIAGLFLISIASLLQFAGLIPQNIPTIYGKKSISGSLLLVFGMMVLSFLFSDTRKTKLRALIVFLMLIFFLTLSFGSGRAGYLSFIILSPVIIYNLIGKRHIIKFIIILFIVIGALLSSPVVQERTKLALNDIRLYYDGNPNTSIGLRLHMWDGAIKIFLENPLIGVGTGGYRLAMKKYETPQLAGEFRELSQPHNSFLYMASSFGILGLFSLFWLFYVFLKKGWQGRNTIAGNAILSYGLIIIIGSLTDTQILSLATAKMFALLAGLRTDRDEA